MAKARNRPVQQELFKPRGGKRRGAGRKAKGKRPSSPHRKRPVLSNRYPVHVTLRVVDEIGNLRKRQMYAALREATLAVARRELNFAEDGAFRIVHLSIQRTHIHLLVEADHATALSRGMQSFQISAAKHLNRAVSVKKLEGAQRRRGTVFPDRFHQEIIRTPAQARHALAYVLNNWRRHQEDRTRKWNVDPYSTGALFTGWRTRANAPLFWQWPGSYSPLFVYLPRTWLLQSGWRRGGSLLEFGEVPGPRSRSK